MQIGNLKLKNKLILAPMAGVTDSVFRSICVRFGAALTFTEMVSAKGLHYQSKNSKALLDKPVGDALCGVQLFGSDPEIIAQQASSKDIEQYDIIDINMGCPARKISGNGEGSALMKNLPLAFKVIKAVVSSTSKPVTVKMRAGWDSDNINAVELARLAQDAGASAVTVHGRTKEQGYGGKADYEIIKQVKQALSIPVIGNGDIYCGADAKKMLKETGCDGVMVARGVEGHPWIFAEIQAHLDGKPIPLITWQEKMAIAYEHGKELANLRGEKVAMLQMRKHLSWYISGIKGVASYRDRINRLVNVFELEQIINELTELNN